MYWDFLAILFLATAPILAGIIKNDAQMCSSNEFQCDSDRCLSLDHVCNGVPDCADGSDEDICVPGASASLTVGDMVNRSRRQSGCRRNQWQCADGSCISFDGKCDGVVDCTDGSDETHALCRKTPCQDNLFRCTYGACVDGTAPCNGIQECADNSDELLPRCSNVSRTSRGKFTCDNGNQISVTGLCDGVADCTDGSDENIRACAGKSCADYLFQCAYGACVDAGSDCNGVQECADNSDESDELCNRTSTAVKPNVTPKPSASPGEGPCELPPHPANGRFEVLGDPFAVPGKRYNRVEIKVLCEQQYAVNGPDTATCDTWTPFRNIPKCERYCLVPMDPSLEFKCETRRGNVLESRRCEQREFPGVDVIPRCVGPNYYGDVSIMRCKDGSFDYFPKCHTGLTDGTNVTILIRDRVEVYISRFQYGRPTVPSMLKPITPSLNNLIDETDWRFGASDTDRYGGASERDRYRDEVSERDRYSGNSKKANVTVSVLDGEVVVESDGLVIRVGN